VSDERFALATGPLPLPRIVAAAREAERLGYEAVMIGEAGTQVDAFVASAAVLQATSRVRCGPGIANVVERHPVTLARGAATLERLAPGRTLLGIGRGDPAWVARLGAPRVSAAALEAAARTCRDLLARSALAHGVGRGGKADVQEQDRPGVRRQLDTVAERTQEATVAERSPKETVADAASNAGAGDGDGIEAAHAPGRPVPLLLAAVGPRTLRLAGALADGVLLNYGAPVEYVRWALAEVAAGARAADRNPAEVDVFGFLFMVRTDAPGAAQRVERLRAELAALHAEPGEGRWLAAQVGTPAQWDDDALRRFAVVGTREECLRRIEEYREAGVRCPVLMPSAMRALHRPPEDPLL
jgi:5,10-methylenetetrahydromethanopterin reductase